MYNVHDDMILHNLLLFRVSMKIIIIAIIVLNA